DGAQYKVVCRGGDFVGLEAGIHKPLIIPLPDESHKVLDKDLVAPGQVCAGTEPPIHTRNLPRAGEVILAPHPVVDQSISDANVIERFWALHRDSCRAQVIRYRIPADARADLGGSEGALRGGAIIRDFINLVGF